MSKFGTKNALFEYFWAKFLRTIVIFEINKLEFVKHESLTHIMNFGIKSSFFNGLVFAFSKGPGPLYKVCHKNATAKEFFLLSNVFRSCKMGT